MILRIVRIKGDVGREGYSIVLGIYRSFMKGISILIGIVVIGGWFLIFWSFEGRILIG